MKSWAVLLLVGQLALAQPTSQPLPFQDAAPATRDPVPMPQLLGLSQSEAENIIAPLKLQSVQVLLVEGGPSGRVIRQFPAVGEPTRMACLYVATGQTSASSPVAPAPSKFPPARTRGVPDVLLFALGQVLLGAFAWVGWIRIEEQARIGPLRPAGKERPDR